MNLPEAALTKRPGILLQVFARQQSTDHFLAVMDWLVEQLPRSEGFENGGGLPIVAEREPAPDAAPT